MSLKEINFSFAGKHCLSDFGCIYVAAKSRPVSPKTVFAEYAISGMSGTASYGDTRIADVMTHSGTLYIMRDMPSFAAAQELYRDIGAWLKQGRRQLVFDYEPMRFLMATCEAQTTFDESGWIDGGLAISFVCQPYAYDRLLTAVSADIGAGGSSAAQLFVSTGQPAPLCWEITNTGTAPIRSVTLKAAGKTIVFGGGMYLLAGQTLAITIEPPIGAEIRGVDGSMVSALPYATQFDHMTAIGMVNATMAVTYGTGTTKAAHVRLSARGRWI